MTTSTTEIDAPKVTSVRVTKKFLSVTLSDGRTLAVPLTWYPRLTHATHSERDHWRLIGSGEGIHWPDLDEDISVQGLLAGRPSGESQRSLMRWLESRPEVDPSLQTSRHQVAQNEKLDKALNEVGAFLRSLLVLDNVSQEHGRHFVLSDANEGSLSLNREEAKEYRRCIANLLDALGNTGQFSFRGVEKLLQRAMWEVVDIRNARSGTPEFRTDRAIHSLRSSLSSHPARYRVFYPVNGISNEGLPISIGNVLFRVFDATQVQEFRDAVAAHPVNEEQKKLRFHMVEEMKQSEELFGQVVGVVEVSAFDAYAAESMAFRDLRLITDAVNFFSDMIPYNSAYISLPGDADQGRIAVPKMILHSSGPPSLSVNYRNIGRLGHLSLPQVEQTDSEGDLGFVRVSQMLRRERTELEDQIVASLQWAGRATVDRRKEEAFLLYAIALESLVMGEGDHRELSYRLKLRIAHLLGETAEKRKDIFKDVDDLYKIRSKIVHSGHYQVSDADLSLIRLYAKGSIMRLCTSQEFANMSSTKDLANWFERHLLE